MNKNFFKGLTLKDILVCISVIIVALLFVFACIFIPLKNSMSAENDYNTDVTNTKLPYIESADYCYYYTLLSDNQKQVYNKLVSSLQNDKTSFEFKRKYDVDSVDDYLRIFVAVEKDHPELFWFTGGYDGGLESGEFVRLRPSAWDFWDFSLSRKKQINELEEAANYVAELARQNTSDEYHLVKFVHDYLVETTEYAYEEWAEYSETQHSASCEYIYTAYGCLVNHRAVCAGYAKAFQLVLNKLGIPCTYITGQVYSDYLRDEQKNNPNHAWNRLQLGGEDYYTDVTWDDGVTYIKYTYFNITTAKLEETRTIDTMFAQPLCTSTYYNYYEYGE